MREIIKENVGEYVGEKIKQLIKEKNNLLFCLAAGHTSISICDYLIKAYENDEISFENCSFIALDEWVGINKDDEGSCGDFLNKNLISKINIQEKNVFLFDGKNKNLENVIKEASSFIKKRGGIDVMLLGLGLNGHLGFNEPNSAFDSTIRVENLDETTRKVGVKYFQDSKCNFEKGITLGIKEILESKNIYLPIIGEHKKEVYEKFVESEVTESFPASALKNSHCIVVVDVLCTTERK